MHPAYIRCTVNFHSSQELLCGTGDLSHVTSLEICVDTQENTLGNFGKIYSTSKHVGKTCKSWPTLFQTTLVRSKFVCVLIRGLRFRVSYANMATHSVTLITITFIIQYLKTERLI